MMGASYSIALILVGVAIVLLTFLVQAYRQSGPRKLKGSGEYPPEGQGTMADVERLVRSHHKIQAIKLYRELHGVDLKTAKEAVDKMAAGLPPDHL